MNDKSLKVFIVFCVLISILIGRLFYLQIFHYTEFSEQAVNVKSKTTPELAPRGVIFDRNHKVLANSRPYFSLYVLGDRMENPAETFQILKKLQLIDLKSWQVILDNIAKNSIEPQLVTVDLDSALVSAIEELQTKHPELSLNIKHLRFYPSFETGSHLLGYVGEITLKQLMQNPNSRYRVGDIIGLSGIEKYYDAVLRGKNGGTQIEVNALGKPVRRLERLASVPGNDIELTIDLDLQKKATELLKGEAGAVVALDPMTGEVLALVSAPGFDPNIFIDPRKSKNWQNLIGENYPLHNRALTAFPPGSVFKVVTAMTALEQGVSNPKTQFNCTGSVFWGRREFKCDLHSGHGPINFTNGFIKSCNTVFYRTGLKLSPDQMASTAAYFFLGKLSRIDLPGEDKGTIPNSSWKLKRTGEGWVPGDSMNMAIGQGFIQTTPLQIALMTSALVHPENVMYQPRLLRKVMNADSQINFDSRRALTKLPFSKKNVELIKDWMTQVVLKGTGVNAKIPEIAIAGKTGTAEDPPRPHPHAWFTSFAPAENPQIVVTVFVQGGGHGGVKAAAIARELIKTWNAKRRGKA